MHKMYMEYAIEVAKKSSKEIPVGCVIVIDNKIIASAHNSVEEEQNITKHAEINAITIASNAINSKYLVNANVYVTLEPCQMCYHALKMSQIRSLYFGAYQNGVQDMRENEVQFEVYGGIMEEECKMLLDEFFYNLRK